MTSEAVAYLKRVADQAAKRGERIVGYHGDQDGGHFRFEFARIKAKREPRCAPEEPPRISRGLAKEGAQKSLF